MGIEKFFNSIVKNNTIKKNNILVFEEKIKANFFYIDFNSILYKISAHIEKELNNLLYDIIINDFSLESQNTSKKYGFDISAVGDKNCNHIELFAEHFNHEYVDEIILQLITEEINYIIEEMCDSSLLKTLYIAMDGIPNMGKIIEQKRRRYIGYIVSGIKKKILNDNIDNLNDARKTYEKYKYSFNRGKIGTGHDFMNSVGVLLNSSDFRVKLQSKFKNLTRYVFSGTNVFGEGEKKIMEDILHHKCYGTYVIYSPDADIIILSMIMRNKVNSSYFVMRYDQYNNDYDVVSINILCNNICEYVKKNIINEKFRNCLDDTNISNDIAFLFSCMFGNDFLPKIESIDVRNDYKYILQIYAELLNNSNITCNVNKTYYLTYNIGKKSYINYLSLAIILYKFKHDEEMLICDAYMGNKYRNYNFIKNTLQSNNLHTSIYKYINKANHIYYILRDWQYCINSTNVTNTIDNHLAEFVDNNYDKLLAVLCGVDIFDKHINSGIFRFLKEFLIIEREYREFRFNCESDNDSNNIYDLFKKELLLMFKVTQNKKYALTNTHKLRFISYDRTVESKFHENKLKDNMQKIPVTNYDKDVYSFENMLGKYVNILNAHNDEIGKADLRVINNKYVYTCDEYHKTNIKYYKTYFKNTDINDLCKEYMKGITWVFDFYFNKNNSKYNFNNISVWHYKFHRAPLLSDLSNYINNLQDKNDLKYTFDCVSYDKGTFFTKQEHYLYVNPINVLSKSISLKKYGTVLTNSKLLPDLDVYIDKIFKAEPSIKFNSKVPIDCRRITYLSKCLLKDNSDIDYFKFINLLVPLRDSANNVAKDVTFIPNTYYF